MRARSLSCFLFLLASSCVPYQLREATTEGYQDYLSQWKDRPEEDVIRELGQPYQTKDLEGGKKMLIYLTVLRTSAQTAPSSRLISSRDYATPSPSYINTPAPTGFSPNTTFPSRPARAGSSLERTDAEGRRESFCVTGFGITDGKVAFAQSSGRVCRHRESAFMGIEAEEPSVQGTPSEEGVKIKSVGDKGTARYAHLLAGDVVLSIDAKPVRTVEDLRRVLSGYQCGDQARLTYVRLGKRITKRVVLHSRYQ
jgi:PDZ domain-containing protein